MSDLTPEKIEGLPSAEIGILKDTAESLHQSTVGVLDTPMPPRDYKREAAIRKAMCIKIREGREYLDSQIHDLKAISTELGILSSRLASDKEALESAAMDGFVREKEDRQTYKPKQ